VLSSLERLGLVERLQPVTASARSTKTAYAICDQFLRLHYRFVEPARSQLRTRALASAYLTGAVLPQLDHHTSIAWEEISRQYVLRHLPGVSVIGRWWGQIPSGEGRRTEEREIDVVGVDQHRKPVVFGMCKWTGGEVDFDELNLLDRVAARVEGATGQEPRFLFSRKGFTKRLAAHAAAEKNIHLIEPRDIYK